MIFIIVLCDLEFSFLYDNVRTGRDERNFLGWMMTLYVITYEGNVKRIVERRSKLPEHEASVYRGARNRRGTKKSMVECKRAGRRLLGRGNYRRPSKV